jgi:hypothetical protein
MIIYHVVYIYRTSMNIPSIAYIVQLNSAVSPSKTFAAAGCTNISDDAFSFEQPYVVATKLLKLSLQTTELIFDRVNFFNNLITEIYAVTPVFQRSACFAGDVQIFLFESFASVVNEL